MDNYRLDHRHEKLWLSITNVFEYDFCTMYCDMLRVIFKCMRITYDNANKTNFIFYGRKIYRIDSCWWTIYAINQYVTYIKVSRREFLSKLNHIADDYQSICQVVNRQLPQPIAEEILPQILPDIESAWEKT